MEYLNFSRQQGATNQKMGNYTTRVKKIQKRYKKDITDLSETRLAGEGKVTENVPGYTLYWKGVKTRN